MTAPQQDDSPGPKRIALVIDLAEAKMQQAAAALAGDLTHHAGWAERMGAMLGEMAGEERITQDALLTTLRERMRALQARHDRLIHDCGLLAAAQERLAADPDAPAGDAYRLLRAHFPEGLAGLESDLSRAPTAEELAAHHVQLNLQRLRRRERRRRFWQRQLGFVAVMRAGAVAFLLLVMLNLFGAPFLAAGSGAKTVSLPGFGSLPQVPEGPARDLPILRAFDAVVGLPGALLGGAVDALRYVDRRI